MALLLTFILFSLFIDFVKKNNQRPPRERAAAEHERSGPCRAPPSRPRCAGRARRTLLSHMHRVTGLWTCGCIS